MLAPHRFFFMPPPFGYPMTHPLMMDSRRQNNKAGSSDGSPPQGTGPIITESIYDTFPRRGATYEEPIYMPSNNGGPYYHHPPPHSSYKPGSPEHYEGYYESYRHRIPKKVSSIQLKKGLKSF